MGCNCKSDKKNEITDKSVNFEGFWKGVLLFITCLILTPIIIIFYLYYIFRISFVDGSVDITTIMSTMLKTMNNEKDNVEEEIE